MDKLYNQKTFHEQETGPSLLIDRMENAHWLHNAVYKLLPSLYLIEILFYCG